MPSTALTGLSNALLVDKEKKLTDLQTLNAKLAKLQGVSVMTTPTGGRVTVTNPAKENAVADKAGMAGGSVAWSNGASVMNSSLTNPTEAPVFVPGTVEEGTTSQDVKEMTTEINSYFEGGPLPKSATSPIAQSKISTLTLKRGDLQNKIDEISLTQQLISEILDKRANGELFEPKLNLSALDMEALTPTLRNQVESVIEDTNEFVTNQIVAPFAANQLLLNALNAQLSGLDVFSPVFDLDYGPPISAGNKFVLSEDGLYYNSRTEPVPDLTPMPTSGDMWTLEYASNVGGRGVSFSEEDGIDGAGTIFNLNDDIGKTNPRVLQFYEYDDVLQQFKDDKQAQMLEVSGHITEILANGYAASDAVVQSYTSQLGTVASLYDKKIKKRQRQLEIAAIYGRSTFFVTGRQHPLGQGLFFKFIPASGKAFEYKLAWKQLPDHLKSVYFATLEGGQTVAWDRNTSEIVDVPNREAIVAQTGMWEEIPRIPINDFSYLKEADVPLPLQKKLTLFSEDLDTIIAPYQAKYVVAPQSLPENFTDKLSVDMIGYGDWVHREGGYSGISSTSLSAQGPLFKSLTDDIVADQLLTCYNFLDPAAVTQASSNIYALNNAAEGSTRLDAKLVGHNRNFVYPKGVGTAFLGGTIVDGRATMDQTWEEVYGSYVRLPNNAKDYAEYKLPYNGSKELDNLFYNQDGVTFDFWAYVPNVHSDMTDRHRYRLVLANENSGPVNSNYITANINRVSRTNVGSTAFLGDTGTTDTSRTIGMIMGWRDRGSPEETSNFESSGLEFIIAPTVGQNQKYTDNPDKSWGHSICIADSYSGTVAPTSGDVTQYGMYIPSALTNNSGSSIADVEDKFVHFNIAFDYQANEVRIALNGEHLTTSSLRETLGGDPSNSVTPTAVKFPPANTVPGDPRTQSFLGRGVRQESVSDSNVRFPVFTPWIIGGGYSDTIPKVKGSNFRPMGFLGSNTNNTYQGTSYNSDLVKMDIGSGASMVKGIAGQHVPPLSNYEGGSTGASNKKFMRSGLDGYIGSFKIYRKPLSTKEAKKNFDAQKGFFENVVLASGEK